MNKHAQKAFSDKNIYPEAPKNDAAELLQMEESKLYNRIFYLYLVNYQEYKTYFLNLLYKILQPHNGYKNLNINDKHLFQHHQDKAYPNTF